MLERELVRARTLEGTLVNHLFATLSPEQIDTLCSLRALSHSLHVVRGVRHPTHGDISDEQMRIDLNAAIARAEAVIGA